MHAQPVLGAHEGSVLGNNTALCSFISAKPPPQSAALQISFIYVGFRGRGSTATGDGDVICKIIIVSQPMRGKHPRGQFC